MKIDISAELKKHIKSMKPKKMVDTLFVSYIVLIIVPILLLGSIFMAISAHQQLEQTQNIRVSVLESATEILREKVDAIYNASYDASGNSDILKLDTYKKSVLERSFALVNVKNSLQRIIAQTDVISEIYLYYKNTDIAVSTSGEKRKIYETFNMGREEFCTFLDENNGEFVSINTCTDFDDEKNYLMYIKSVDKKIKTGNIFEICILDSTLVSNIIDAVNLDGAGTAMLLDEDFRCILKIGNDEFNYKKVPEKDFFAQIPDSEYKTVKFDGKKMKFLLKEVPLTNLKIFSCVKNSYYIMKFQYVWFLILIVCMFIIAMGIWVARTYSRRIYQPITNIINLFNPTSPTDLEKSELTFIENKFIEINEMHSELVEYKETYSSYLKELFLYNFIKGYISDTSDFRNRLNDFNIRLATEKYTVLLVKIDRLEDVLKNIQLYHFQTYVKDSFIAAFKNYCDGKHDSLHEFYDNEYIGIIICHDLHIDFEDVLIKVQKDIKRELDITVSVCLGEVMVAWEKLPEAYEKLYNDIMQSKLCGYEFLRFSDGSIQQSSYVNFSQYDEKIHRFITRCDYEQLDGVIEEMFGGNELLYSEILQLYNSFVITLINIINGSGYSANDILMNVKPYADVEKFSSVRELCEYLKRVCRMIGEQLADTDREKNIMLGKINEYFEHNYMKQITLETIAKEFGFSAGYFSRYFKEITGKKYIEMLNGYRIEKAKEIICTDKTAKLFEVSEMVGFVRYRTFSDAFKKYDGQSPENFKRSL